MELREMARIFGQGMRQVASTGEANFGFGGNGRGYAGNQGQRRHNPEDDNRSAQSFGADGVSFTSLRRNPAAGNMRVSPA